MKYIDCALLLAMFILIIWPQKEGGTSNLNAKEENSIKRLYRQAELSEERLEATIFREKIKEQRLLKHHRELELKYKRLEMKIKKDSIN